MTLFVLEVEVEEGHNLVLAQQISHFKRKKHNNYRKFWTRSSYFFPNTAAKTCFFFTVPKTVEQ